MKHTILSVAAVLMSTTAYAQDTATTPYGPVLSGEVSLDFAETANDKWGGTMGLELGVDAAGLGTVDLDFTAVDGGAVTLDNWKVETTVGALGVAIGDDNGLMPEAEGEHTLAAPAMTESVAVTAGAASVALGFTDWTTDIADISNIQGAYALDMVGVGVTVAADYNMDSENTVLAGAIEGVDLGVASIGGSATYDTDAEKFAFEGIAKISSLTAYLNGDEDDATQNVGGEYVYTLGGAELTAGANYDLNAEELAPTATLSFAF